MRPDLQSEVRALRAELARVREQRDILKKHQRPPAAPATPTTTPPWKAGWPPTNASASPSPGRPGGYGTCAEAKADFFDYGETYYDRVRCHSALGFQSPADFENQLNYRNQHHPAAPKVSIKLDQAQREQNACAVKWSSVLPRQFFASRCTCR
jgi:hypothetical protein